MSYVLWLTCLAASGVMWLRVRSLRDDSDRIVKETREVLADNRALQRTLGLMLQSNQRLHDLLREEQEKDKK